MKRVIPIILIAAVIGLAVWLWGVLFPSPEKVVRSRLNALAKAISFSSSGGALGKAYDAQKAANFFTTSTSVVKKFAAFWASYALPNAPPLELNEMAFANAFRRDRTTFSGLGNRTPHSQTARPMTAAIRMMGITRFIKRFCP